MNSALSTPVGDLQRLEEISRPKITVYNPTDYDENDVRVGGHVYAFPARGTCVISDQWKHPWEKDTTGRLRANTSKRVVAIAAKDIALHIVDDGNRGRKGFAILLGDGHDEGRKHAAREKYLAWRMDYALSVERSWVAQCAAYGTANPGSVPPRPSKAVRAELAWLDENRKGLIGRRRFVCQLDSLDYEVEAEALDHARLAHPGLDAAKVVLDTVAHLKGRPAEAIEAEQHGPETAAPPIDQQVLDVAVLVTTAEELGVQVTKAELTGLIKQDAATIELVTKRVATAQAKAAEAANGDVANG